MKKQFMQLSFFTHTWEKKSKEISLSTFIADVRSPRWQVLATSYRRYLEQEHMLQEAERLKGNLPAVAMAGTFKGGHAAMQIQSLSCLLMTDLDHTDDQTAAIKAKMEAEPYVMAAFVSVSGKGLKVVVRIEVDNAQQYKQAYPVVAREISRVAGFPCDMQCRDLSRLCYVSYDPQAYFNPQACSFQWHQKTDAADNLTDASYGSPFVATTNTSACIIPRAGGFAQGFLSDFERRNPFMKGSRNDFLLKLGRAARYKEFSQSELAALTQLAVDRYAVDDLTPAFVEKRLMAGYQFVDSSPAPFPPQAQAHGYQGSFNEPPSDEGEEEATEVMLEKSGVLRRSLPYFPDDLFDHLPKLLTEGLKMARHPRERDMLLLGMLANLSGCLPQVKLLYDQVYYSPHFYFLAIAHAGGGKGVLSLAALLPNAIAKHYEQQNEQTMKVYNQAMQDWDVEQRKALSERRAADLSLCPERPKLITLKVSPNISKSRLILYLEANGKLGVIINAPELDMVSGAIRQDCGKHDDVFRAAFQHEEVSSDYKIDGRQVMAHHPHLACCFSGTPDQLSKFIVSWENGLYSRMTIYAGEADWVWRSAAPREQGTDSRAVFIELSRQLLEMHLFLLQSPTEVVFSTEQWEQHTQRFGRWLQEVVGEKENSPGAIVLRHGLMAIRIASILTTLRKCECPFCTPQYSCTDEDFTTAMQLVEVLIEHSLLLSTALISDETHTRKLRSFFRLRPILDSLDVTFTYHEYITEVKKKEMPISTAKRLLSKAVRCYLLDKDDDKYTKKLITPLMGKA